MDGQGEVKGRRQRREDREGREGEVGKRRALGKKEIQER